MTKINLLINNPQVKTTNIMILNQQLFYIYLCYKNKDIVKYIYIFIENISILIDPVVKLFF